MNENHQFVDLSGKRFGRLIVTKRVANDPHGMARWLCQCQCGGSAVATGNNLRRGRVVSCGCKHQEDSRDRCASHGYCFTPEHACWRNIRNRARKLKLWIDPGWQQSFENFIRDMGDKPSPGHRLRRSGLDDSYGPLNCYWEPPAHR